MKAKIIVPALIGLLLLLLIASMLTQARRITWVETFSHTDKDPFGTYILYDRLGDLFPTAEVLLGKDATYYALDEANATPTTYVVITNEYLIDTYDLERLLDFVAEGNYGFIMARDFPEFMQDSLGFSLLLHPTLKALTTHDSLHADSSFVRFTHPELLDYKGFDLIRAGEYWSISSPEANDKYTVLAYNQYDLPCLISIAVGDGRLVLGTTPRMFTNYFLLHREDHRFAEAALSFIPSGTDILWDDFYKGGKGSPGAQDNDNDDLLSYIRSEPALHWAYWIIAMAMLVYVVFESKRNQRVIPERKPLPNATLEFTETVGRLYYQSHDHKNVADKKIKILLAYIRSQYFLKTGDFNPEFINSLSGKSGMPLHEVRTLCRMIERIQKQEQITESELLELNLLVESFYHFSNGRT